MGPISGGHSPCTKITGQHQRGQCFKLQFSSCFYKNENFKLILCVSENIVLLKRNKFNLFVGKYFSHWVSSFFYEYYLLIVNDVAPVTEWKRICVVDSRFSQAGALMETIFNAINCLHGSRNSSTAGQTFFLNVAKE